MPAQLVLLSHVHATRAALAGAVGLSQQNGFLHPTPGNLWSFLCAPGALAQPDFAGELSSNFF